MAPPTHPDPLLPRDRPSVGQWRAMLDVVPGYLLLADGDRRIISLNRATPGRSLEGFIGRDFADFVVEAQRPLVVDAARRILGGGGAIELEAQGADSRRWFRARMTGVLERGQVTGFVAHVLDVDDVKHLEGQRDRLRARADGAGREAVHRATSLSDVERRLELLADALPVLVSYVDRRRRYQYNNAAYTRWFGVSPEDLRGRTMDEFLGETAYAQVRSYVEAVLAGKTMTFETTIPYRQAGVRRVVARYVPDLTGEGEVSGFYVLIEDVTSRRKAEAALQRREEELHQLQKMEALGRLARSVAHDFNNLLQSVVNSCATLEMVLPDGDSQAAETVQSLKHVAQHGASLTRQLLTFSRDQPSDRERVDVCGLISGMKKFLHSLLGPGIVVEVDCRQRCLVEANAVQLQQVIVNLVANARDAMPDGGVLRIAVDAAELDRGAAAIDPSPDSVRYALVTVTDAGTGMDPDTAARAFEPFFTTKPEHRGTGLGLSTVYGIVQGLAGHIELNSAVGQGTTVRLYLPLAGGTVAGVDPAVTG